MLVQITEALDIDLDRELWRCNKCKTELVSCKKSYKEGCLVAEREPSDVHNPVVKEGVTFSPDPRYCKIIEYYCPNCGLLIEVEYLPPGHPPLHDIEIDIESIRTRLASTDN